MEYDKVQLPITAYSEEILRAIDLNPITVVIGETGSGKTTQISQVSCSVSFPASAEMSSRTR